jgi:DNA sulfur modification protein DndC
VRELELITVPELEEIRRIWVVDKHEIEDRLPALYEEVTGQRYPGRTMNEGRPFTSDALHLLADACDGDRIHYELVRELLDIEHKHRTKARRAGLLTEIEKAIRKGFYASKEDALEHALSRETQRAESKQEWWDRDYVRARHPDPEGVSQ